jgi:D-alanyl-D-alanine carboxypeptidase
MRARMIGVSWHPGCPVPLSGLRLITLTYRGFDGRDHTGQLVANRAAAGTLVAVFRRLYAARFPIRRMRPVDAYGGDDYRSIEADNTSAFNCRAATGSTHWSEHAYGRAIDVNPIENPYVSGGKTSHAASRPYLDRSRHLPGVAYEGGPLVEAFRSEGWGWGGRWTGIKDYQHFSASGR